MQPSASCAQSVQVDMSVLEDLKGYEPPPMFDATNAPLTGYGGARAVQKFPLEIKTYKKSVDPGFAPHQTIRPRAAALPVQPVTRAPLTPVMSTSTQAPMRRTSMPSTLQEFRRNPTMLLPRPGRKPYFNKTAKVGTQQVAYTPRASVAPPVPKKRPSKLNASPSFIKQATASQTAYVPPPPPMPKTPVDITSDPLDIDIETPSVQDVLRNIESSSGPINITAAQDPPAPPARPTALQGIKFSAKTIVSLGFMPGSIQIEAEEKRKLDSRALSILSQNPNLRVQIQAYASPAEQGQSSARRLSLSRAIFVRSYLIDKNIDPKRIDVRALGESSDVGPTDRVDLVFTDKNDPP